MTARDKTKRAVLAVELDHAELTIRLMEIGLRMKRPIGVSARNALLAAKASGDEIKLDIIQDFEDMATASIEYLRNAINNMGSVQ